MLSDILNEQTELLRKVDATDARCHVTRAADHTPLTPPGPRRPATVFAGDTAMQIDAEVPFTRTSIGLRYQKIVCCSKACLRRGTRRPMWSGWAGQLALAAAAKERFWARPGQSTPAFDIGSGREQEFAVVGVPPTWLVKLYQR
jgi:hypothetical protein